MNLRVLAPWIVAGAIAALLAVPARGQDGPTEVTGQAILGHAAGATVVEAAKLLKAGKLAEVKQASMREVREEWAAMSAADQRGWCRR